MEKFGIYILQSYNNKLKFIIMAKKKETIVKEFIAKSKVKFGDKFDYSKMNYIDSKTPITLICKEHGEIHIAPGTHLRSTTGYQECSKHVPRKRKTLVDGKNRKEMREYRIWKAIRTRVSNTNLVCAERYSLKDVKLCDRWDSFELFYEDMGPCPEGYSIDRIDPDGDYCPENCRWANATTQSQNRGDFNLVYTYNGETHVLKEWARILGIKYTTLYLRITRSGLSFENAIKKDPFNRLIEYEGEQHTLAEWCKIKNMEYGVVLNRLDKHKWSFEEAITTPKGCRRQNINKDIV